MLLTILLTLLNQKFFQWYEKNHSPNFLKESPFPNDSPTFLPAKY